MGGVLLTDGSIATVFAWLDDEDRQVLITRLGDDAEGTFRVVNRPNQRCRRRPPRDLTKKV